MKTIWKFDIQLTDVVSVTMPQGAKLLHVGLQARNGQWQPVVWALVDSDSPMVTRVLRVAGTGHPLRPTRESDEQFYVGTILIDDGLLVLHVFDLGEQ